jgi:hypothetical protein
MKGIRLLCANHGTLTYGTLKNLVPKRFVPGVDRLDHVRRKFFALICGCKCN